MAWHLASVGIFGSLATASVVVPEQQALIQSNKHLHQDLLPATGVYDQVWLMELVARAISSVIMMWLLLTLAKRFGSMQDEDTDLNQKTRPQDELRPFWWAVEMGDVELLSSILDADPALACRVDEEGRTALHVAAFTGASESLKFLLQRKMNVNMPDANGETALHLAAGAGHLCCLIILLDAGASQDLKNTAGCTALGKAKTADEKAACELLVDHGGVQLAFES